jgi:hypothetical protein
VQSHGAKPAPFNKSGSGKMTKSGSERRVIDFGGAKYRAKAWQYGARAQGVPDSERRADLLRFSGMWLSLTEPIDVEVRGAHEWPRNDDRRPFTNERAWRKR